MRCRTDSSAPLNDIAGAAPAQGDFLHHTPKAASRGDPEVHLLALNSGSSSLKFGLYRVGSGGGVVGVLTGEAETVGGAAAVIHAEGEGGRSLLHEACPTTGASDVLSRIGKLLADGPWPAPRAIGHRIVHGGPRVRRHCVVDAGVMGELEAAVAFAPLHTPAALAVLRCAAEHFPGLPQVACLDTCFHAGMPPVASTLPLPPALRAAGLQRYGFHGLSCESIVHELAAALPPRLVVAHLGNGASITAVRRGQSIDTSMGLTPTGGLIMGTRSGDLDPGVIVHLMREMQFDAAMVEDLVDHRCGLLGISGLSGDMRALHAAAATDVQARLAIEMFCYRVAKEVGAMGTALGGIDEIVFTGGIGENDAVIRAGVCARLAWLGVALDDARNRRGTGRVSGDASRCAVQVLPSQEDLQIARHTWALRDRWPR